MAKGDKKKAVDVQEQAVIPLPEISIFKNKDNSPKLSIPPVRLETILEYFDAGGEFETIALECHKDPDHLEITCTNNTNDIMANYIGLPEDTKILNPGYFILEVKKILEILSKKYKKSKVLVLTWEPNEKLTLKDEKGNPVSIALKSINTISKNIPALDRRFKYKNQIMQFNKKIINAEQKLITEVDKDGVPVTEDAKTKVLISQSELMRAASDIDISGSDYVILNFNSEGSFSESGTWNVKGDTSRTDGLECEVKGPLLSKPLPQEFVTILKKLSGDIDIQGTQLKPVVGISQWIGQGDLLQEMHYNIMQNKKKE
jgi:hypothetical protein